MWAPCCQETVSHSGQLLRPFMQDDLGCSKQKGMHWVRGLTSPPHPLPDSTAYEKARQSLATAFEPAGLG